MLCLIFYKNNNIIVNDTNIVLNIRLMHELKYMLIFLLITFKNIK